jgi:hypothetical protein
LQLSWLSGPRSEDHRSASVDVLSLALLECINACLHI